jgi:hypothetical protein
MNHPRPTTDKSQTKISEHEVQERSRNQLQAVLVSLLILAALLTLFALRLLDDNRLVSWLWIFADFSPMKFFIILAVGMLIAYPLSRFSLPERTSIFLLSISSFLVAAFFWQQPEVIVDASRYFVQAKHLELYGVGYFLKEWGNEIPAWTDLPLIPFIYGAIFRIFGENRSSIQIFNTLLFSGTVVLTYLIGKTLWNKNIGLYAGALLLGMPYLIIQVPLMMVDVATMFFLTLAVFATIKAVDSRKAALFISASVAITLAMLTKYSIWLMLSIIPIIFLAYLQQDWKVLARRGSAMALGVLLLMVIFLLTKFDLIFEQLQILHDFQAPALYRWQESWISTFFFQIHPVITLSALFSIYIAIINRDAKYLIICWMVVLVFLLEIKRIRYSIPVFPMLAIMGSYGISALRNIETRKFIVSCTAVSAVLITTIAYLPFLEKTSTINIMQAGKYLDSINTENAEVFVLPQTTSSINPVIAVQMLDLFTKKDIVYLDRREHVAPQNITELPWRWTWEIQSPLYSANQDSFASNAETIVVIQSSRSQQVPQYVEWRLENYRLVKKFSNSSGVFKYRTLVYIYQHT